MKVLFLGRGELGYTTLERLLSEDFEVPVIVTCDHSPDVGGSAEAFRKLAENKGIDYFHTNNINTDKWVQKLKSYNADIGIALLWLYIIREPIISATKHGLLNFHAGDLPRYRGNACTNWAILQGEKQIGFSVHLMEPGRLDSGPIILKDYLPLKNDTTIGDVTKAYSKIGVEMIIKAVRMFAENDVNPEPQDNAKALYCYPRLPRDGEINWDMPSEKIYNLIRAAGKPFPGAYTYYRDSRKKGAVKKMIIWKAHVESHSIDFLAKSGHLIKLQDSEKWAVATADKKLLILDEIEIDGKIADPRKAFKSIRIRLGMDVTDEIMKLREELADIRKILHEEFPDRFPQKDKT